MNEQSLRQAREISLQILFQKEFSPQFDYIESLKHFQMHFNIEQKVLQNAQNYIFGVLEKLEDIDKLIESHSNHWKIDRMALVDLNLLRLSIFELLFSNDPQPVAVIINESLEIAKKYSSKDSSQFINGVLDQIAKENNK